MKYSLHPSVPTPHLSFKFRTGPASAPSLAEKHKGHREAARIGTGELPSSNGEAQTHGACLALRPAPRHRHMRARCLLYACRIPRSAAPPPGRAPHRTTLPEKKASASLPSRFVQEVLDRLLPYCRKAYPIRVCPVKPRRFLPRK